MTNQRRKFDTNFKLEVVRMIHEQGLSARHVSQSMGVGLTAIRRWVTQYKAELSGQRGIGNPLTAEQQQIRQLEQENRRLRMDVDILKNRPHGLPRPLCIETLASTLRERGQWPTASWRF